ncbi:MAG: hypothetical protein AAF598_12655 [Bacteroidota bacterium]
MTSIQYLYDTMREKHVLDQLDQPNNNRYVRSWNYFKYASLSFLVTFGIALIGVWVKKEIPIFAGIVVILVTVGYMMSFIGFIFGLGSYLIKEHPTPFRLLGIIGNLMIFALITSLVYINIVAFLRAFD